jgi:rubredoxin
MGRANFSKTQKEAAFDVNWQMVREDFTEFKVTAVPHYRCENCNFINNNKSLFQVDHLVPCKDDGNNSVDTVAVAQAITEERDVWDSKGNQIQKRSWDPLNIGLLMLANANDQILCRACNLGKNSTMNSPDLVPAGCGYAYSRRSQDQNPRHRYQGPPPLNGPVLKRYRDRWEKI